MACSCGSASASSGTYVHIAPSGKKTSYSTEVEAKSAVQRLGGSYKRA